MDRRLSFDSLFFPTTIFPSSPFPPPPSSSSLSSFPLYSSIITSLHLHLTYHLHFPIVPASLSFTPFAPNLSILFSSPSFLPSPPASPLLPPSSPYPTPLSSSPSCPHLPQHHFHLMFEWFAEICVYVYVTDEGCNNDEVEEGEEEEEQQWYK